MIEAKRVIDAYTPHRDFQAVVYAENLNHAEAIAEAFVYSGVAAELISSELQSSTRRALLRLWHKGWQRVAVGVMENWPEFAAPVSIVARRTTSQVLHDASYSQVTQLVIDLTDNIERLGVPSWYKGRYIVV